MCMIPREGGVLSGGKMSQIEELKVFVSDRLHAAASEILGAIEKTVKDYEEQASRLKEENDRHRCLLDIILKVKSPQTEAGHPFKRTPATACPGASDASPRPEKPKSKARKAPCYSSDWQWAFTSRTDFLKFAASDDCAYCLKRDKATETHLIRKHYLNAVHFNADGTEKFVVPCTCKDLIQGRSHWHCPYCKKIINRKSNFEIHIFKQHGSTILQQRPDEEISQPSAFEEGAPLSLEPWCQQDISSMHQEDHQASLLLQVKQEEQESWNQVSHPEWQNSVQLQIKGEQIQKGNSEMSLEANQDFNTICVDSYIQDLSKINSAQNGKGRPLPDLSGQPLETQRDLGVGGTHQQAGESQHTTPRSRLKALNSKRKKCVKTSLPPLSRKSTKLSVSQNPTSPHCCKACGKTFYYLYTLRTHAQTHAVDKTHICGICGKHLESTESLVQHLPSHTKRSQCGICGKQFSNNSRLKRHKRFHRPKGLNVTSSL